MAMFITAVRLSGGTGHEHITAVRWLNCDSEKSNTSSTADFVKWLQDGNSAFVADADGKIRVQVVNAHPPYLRTVADNRYTDNLLSLPTY